MERCLGCIQEGGKRRLDNSSTAFLHHSASLRAFSASWLKLLLSVVSVATASWTCFQTRHWSERSSRTSIKPSNRESGTSRVSSEPTTRPSPTPCRRTSADNKPAVAELRGYRGVQMKGWTALWQDASWGTGCWLRTCSDSCRGNGPKTISREPPVRAHWTQTIQMIAIIRKENERRRRNEGGNGRCSLVWQQHLGLLITSNDLCTLWPIQAFSESKKKKGLE